MNILFFSLYGSNPRAGGVENVTSFLCQEFINKGHCVSVICWKNDLVNPNIQTHILPISNVLYCNENLLFLRNLIYEAGVEVLINQNGINFRTSKLCIDAVHGIQCKLISVIHNSPKYLLNELSCRYAFLKFRPLLYILKKIYSLYNRYSRMGACYCYDSSDYTVLLSNKYRDSFIDLFLRKDTDLSKLITIPNPVTINVNYNFEGRQNIILFVGRLSSQKGIDRLLNIWKKLAPQKERWKLCLVGDGELKEYISHYISKHRIERCCLLGRQDPLQYYRISKIFCMTSVYEGFPMTLLECMANGVVPVVYNSFEAVHDLIDNNVNGFIVEDGNEDKYIEILNNLMADEKLLNRCSAECENKLQAFTIDSIYNKWNSIF